MWRSFGQGAGGPMGGGGGGGILKTVHKALSAGTGGRGSYLEPFFLSATTNYNSTTSPTSRPTYKPSSSDYNSDSNTRSFSSVNILNNRANSISSTSGDIYDAVNGFYDDYVFGTVPSMDEVHDAVSSLQQVLDPPTSSHEFDWIEPSRSMLQSSGSENVYDAFHLLLTEPTVKKMVISLASDKSVWDAVMNNEAVRELRDSIHDANKSISASSGETESGDGSFPVSDILNWIFINIKAKAMEVIEKITEMVNSLLQSPRNDKKAKEEGTTIEPFEKKLKSSFLLSVIVLLIVVVSRANRS